MSLLSTRPALALDEDSRLDIAHPRLINAALLHESKATAACVGPATTTYVGFKPGTVTPLNYWGIGTGNFVPGSTNVADYGYWGWDNDVFHNNIGEVHSDSLFGWWPIRNLYTETGGLTLADTQRPWWAIDMGNMANYVINQGDQFNVAHLGVDLRRTFGVIGVWHIDPGNTGVGAGHGVGWTPPQGTRALWCGLRREDDFSISPMLDDPITKNPFNGRVMQYSGVSQGNNPLGGIGTNKKWPGYGSQWDQMAYRDINISGSPATITLDFDYQTRMSTTAATAPDIRTGWFEYDPLSVGAPGNFVSAGAGGGPVDRFTVYIGAPVNDAACHYSDGGVRKVYDKQRRWFSEVLQINQPITTALSVTGNQGAHATIVVPVQAAWGTKARIVFRVKTNRGFDDESGSVLGAYSSGGAGAAVIDNVSYTLAGGASTLLGDFESTSQVDNDLAVDPLNAWKTTGKPPGIFHHVDSVDNLLYEDLCGPPGTPSRKCALAGNVISAGDHDNSEAGGGLTQGEAERERMDGIVSPTINLCTAGGANAMGITNAIASAADDWYVVYDIYAGMFDLSNQGNAWRFGFQTFPATQSDGARVWGDLRVPNFVLFDPDKQCFQDREPGFRNGLIRWDTNVAQAGDVHPDSVRFFLGKVQECFRFGVSAACSPTDGAYYDDVSLAFVDAAPRRVAMDPWQWINDAFTVNGLNRANVAPGTALFDTTTALVKNGLNIAQATGNPNRYVIPGDSMVAVAEGPNVRVDLVFRIQPGPGNYTTLGNTATSLRKAPSSITPVNYPSASNDGNFWAEYLRDNGTFGTAGGHPAGAVNGGKRWDTLVWNSARCDTAEINLWPILLRSIGGPKLGHWMSMYHESDPKYPKLGILKNRCYLVNPAAAVTLANTTCDLGMTNGNWPVAAGLVPEIVGQPAGITYEYTKILPDGQLTPGSHVEYAFRRQDLPAGTIAYAPDPNTVYPQPADLSLDAHRWQEFSVVPDRWKNAAYGGLGQACMLYMDLDDGRGDERVWVAVADSIGATRAAKYGAHNGWHDTGKVCINDPAGFIEANQEPGTTWDMYGVKASESLTSKLAMIGSNLSNHNPTFVNNKWSFQGPSIDMLNAYYRIIMILSGDLNRMTLGPYPDLGQNDVLMLRNFLLSGTPSDHRGLFIEGSGFAESMLDGIGQSAFLHTSLDADLVDPNYRLFTLVSDECVKLVIENPITTNGDIYGIRNSCIFPHSILTPLVGGTSTTHYLPTGAGTPPLVAGVFHNVNGSNSEYWQSLLDGWDIQNLLGLFCEKTYGRLAYYNNVFTNIFGKICAVEGTPVITTDVPNIPDGRVFADAMSLRGNPMSSGPSSVELTLASPGRVRVQIYDVAGRVVRTLADRRLPAGPQSLVWDGSDDTGRPVARGVYFARARYAESGFVGAKKLIVLR